MKKIGFSCCGCILVIIVGGVIALAYFGIIPGLSRLFSKQKSLNVESNRQLVLDMADELGFSDLVGELEVDSIDNFDYKGNIEVDRVVDSSEVTSLLNYWQGQYSRVPFENIQAQINEDSVAISATMLVDKGVEFAKDLGYSSDQIDSALTYVNFLSGELPVYLEFDGSVENNNIDFNMSSLKIGNIPVPSSIRDTVAGGIEDIIERSLSEVNNLDIQEISFEDDGARFVGTIPASVEVSGE